MTRQGHKRRERGKQLYGPGKKGRAAEMRFSPTQPAIGSGTCRRPQAGTVQGLLGFEDDGRYRPLKAACVDGDDPGGPAHKKCGSERS